MSASDPMRADATRRNSAWLSPVGPEPSPPAWLLLAPSHQLRTLETAGVRLDRTTSGAVFVQRLRETDPRVAIASDPPASSSDVLALISERRQRGTLRIVLINDVAAIRQRLDALALGFDEALPNSIDPAELVGRIRLMLGGARNPHAEFRDSVIAPGIRIDLAGRRVIKDGAEIHLRPKEFALLALLAGDPGRVYTRDELVDLVWGPGYRGNLRTVDVHVRWLRAKLEADPARPRHVVTVRGTGYRLDPAPDVARANSDPPSR